MRRTIASLFLALLTAAATTVSPAPAVATNPRPDPRIVGGSESAPGAYPFMAAVVDRHRTNAWYGLICGGAVIGSNWVVTAASCVVGIAADDLDVVVGRHDLTSDEGIRVHVAGVGIHPSYSPGSQRYDTALLELAVPVPAGTLEMIAPEGASLPATATIAGWGDTETAERFPRSMRHAQIALSDIESCHQIFGTDFDPMSMLCAGDPAAGANTCTGDHGGPLFAPDGDRWVLLGTASWGVGCDVPGFPGVYADTRAAWGWIHSTTGLGTMYCDGRPATLVGTEGADFLTGTDGPDVIASLGGSDRIEALGGDDLICAGAGNDQISGGDGNDIVWAGPGNDQVDGGSGDDALYGESGNDRLSGGTGADLLAGGMGRDLLRGGDGNDTLTGGPNRDRLFGNGGDDLLAGEGGPDSIYGGVGADDISGGKGSDEIHGDSGDDTLRGNAGDDAIDGGSGADDISGGSGADRIEGGAGADRINGGSGNDDIEGGDDDDLLDGGAGDDRIDGGDGDDSLFGRGGDDTLIGGLGTDDGNGGAGFDGCFVETSRACELPV